MVRRTNRYEDDDASHLPPGMKRVGYDTDTERYTFREGDDLWLGEPGLLYGGRLKWAGKAPDVDPAQNGEDEHLEEYTDSSDWESDDCEPTLHKHAPKALSESKISRPQQGGNEWGVPVAYMSSISATPAKSPGRLLERKATKFKEAAMSTVTAIRVTRRWTRKRENSRAVQQEKSMLDEGVQDGQDDDMKSPEVPEKD